MNKWKSSLISLGMTAFFAVGCYFMPSQVNVFWTIVVSTMTFLLSFVFIELLEYTKVLKDFDMNFLKNAEFQSTIKIFRKLILFRVYLLRVK